VRQTLKRDLLMVVTRVPTGSCKLHLYARTCTWYTRRKKGIFF